MNLVEALKNRKVQLGIAAVAILLAVALTLVWVLQPKNDNPQTAATPPAASASGDADGTAVTSPDAAPPASPGACSAPDEPKTAAWWNLGPTAGSNAGQVVLSIHTYQSGEAVGNQLYKDGTSQLAAGDVLKLTSADGRTACYQFTEDQKVDEATFDRDSDLLERQTGDPALAIVICWDYNKDTSNWDSRIFFKFKPVTEEA